MLIQDKEKSPIDVGASTDCMKKSFNDSIPQSATTKHLVIEMESTKLRDPIGLDSFPLGTVRSF